jgi:hypothetical protein
MQGNKRREHPVTLKAGNVLVLLGGSGFLEFIVFLFLVLCTQYVLFDRHKYYLSIEKEEILGDLVPPTQTIWTKQTPRHFIVSF